MTRTSPRTRLIMALVLWVLQLAAPTVGLLYVAAKVSRGLPLGPQALAVLGLCLLWYGAVILVACLRRGRAWLAARLPQMLLMYMAAGMALILAEALLTFGDAVLGLPFCRPHTLSWWAFAPDVPPLNPEVIVDPDRGTRYNITHVDPNFNLQGFRDRDDFSRTPDEAAVRILLLGDSFAFGCSAIADGSNTGFADVLEERLQRDLSAQAVLWNTSMPGVGQREQVLRLKEYFPVLKPQLVLLAFYEGNDFIDNVFPAGHFFGFADNNDALVYRYVLDKGAVRKLSPREAWLRARGYPFESAPALACLRTVSVVYRQFPRDADWPTFERGIDATRELLAEVADYVRRQGAELLVVVIPSVLTVKQGTPMPDHVAALDLLEELAIPYINLRPHMTTADYVADGHWNKQGHHKAADVLFEHVVRLVNGPGYHRRGP